VALGTLDPTEDACGASSSVYANGARAVSLGV
jgi:hypothetical protein